MADHDDLCPRKWHGVLQGAACGYCDMLRSARADEREKIAQALEVYDFIDGDKAAQIARKGHE